MIFDDERSLAQKYQEILAPISVQNPAGEDVRRSGHFDWVELRDARRGEQAGHLCPDGADVSQPDWDRVRTLATLALKRNTKDLQVAIWLAQALTFLTGLNGVCEGLFVVRELIERYAKAGLHPRDDEEQQDPFDESPQGEMLLWFDRELAGWIELIPFTPYVDGRSYSLADLSDAQTRLRWLDLRHDYWTDRAPDKQIEFDFQRMVGTGDERFFRWSYAAVQQVREQLNRLMACLTEMETPLRFDSTARAIGAWETALPDFVRTEAGEASPPEVPEIKKPVSGVSAAESIESRWQKALGFIRLQRFDKASDLIEAVFAEAAGERDRFLRKTDLAAALVEVKRYDLAVTHLEFLSRQIDQFQLQKWEDPKIPVRVWKLLHDCYRFSGTCPERARELEKQLSRIAPWTMLH